MKIFLSYLDAYERVTSAEDFNNHVDKTNSVDASQTFPPAVSILVLPWANDQSGHWCRNIGDAEARQHGLSLTKLNIAMASTDFSIFQKQRPTLSS